MHATQKGSSTLLSMPISHTATAIMARVAITRITRSNVMARLLSDIIFCCKVYL